MKAKLLLLIILTGGLILRLWLAPRQYSGDVNNHLAWGTEMLLHGPLGIYQREFYQPYEVMKPTYPPLALGYFGAAEELFHQTIRVVYGLEQKYHRFTGWVIALGHPNSQPAFFKIPAILADAGSALLVYLILKRMKRSEKMALGGALVIALNPAIWFNSASWGQIDTIPVFFLLLTGLLLQYRRFYLSVLALTGAILTKQSSLVFIPFYGIYLWRNTSFKTTVVAGFTALTVFFLTFLPFVAGWPLGAISTYLRLIQVGSGSDYLTDHAFNLWWLLTGPGKIHDGTVYFGLPAFIWGVVFSGGVLVWLGWQLWLRPTARQLWLSWILAIMTLFFLATRMHERYLAPAVMLFLLPWKRWTPWIIGIYGLISLFQWSNLYQGWWEPVLPGAVEVLSQPWLIAGLILTMLSVYGWLLLQSNHDDAQNF
jgi:hypothetical protein